MPITVNITDNGLGFIMVGEGDVTGKEIIAGIDERFSSESKIRKYLYGMSDYTKVTTLNMTTDEVRRVAAKDKHVSGLNPDLVIAIAAPKSDMFGLSRMFEMFADDTGWSIDVHRDMETAKKDILNKLKGKGVDIASINFTCRQ